MNGTLHTKNEGLKKTWMVVYTRSKWEKKVDRLLKEKGVECFCPLIKTSRKWADRNTTVEMPLFSSYLFVRIHPLEQNKVRETMGITNFIYYCGKPAIVNDFDIERIRQIVDNYKDVETLSIRDFSPGDRIKITQGAFMNCEGEIMEIKGKSVLISIQQLDCVLIAKVSVNQNIIFANSIAGTALAAQA